MTDVAQKKKVFVGMSGGVDSSVAAYLLKQQGYDVVGVFIKVWHPGFLPCHWEKERLDAMRVAAHLDIPFLTCTAEEAYKRDVADYFIEEYRKGRTPNPDVMCNTYIKFGRFYEFARSYGADYIATGHYAQIEIRDDEIFLERGLDENKDQTYFLWNAPHDALRATLFPIGHLPKDEVRKIAERAGLPTARKDDSQGICFLGKVDMFSFLSHYIDLKEGVVTNETGTPIGTHKGTVLYTEGQRHGFHIDGAYADTTPYFVVSKNLEKNTLVVSHTKEKVLPHESGIFLSHAKWFIDLPKDMECTCQVRYRQTPLHARISLGSTGFIHLLFDDYAEIPAEGQSCVVYVGERVIGGGIIERSV